MPTFVRWLGIAAISLCSLTASAEVLKPYVVLMLDTSGSMVNTPGAVTNSGPPSCGGADLRLNHARCAINKIVNSYGDMVFALGRFRETGGGDFTSPSPDSCDLNGNGQGAGADGCTTSGVDCNACACNGRTEDCSGCSTSLYADHRGEMLTGLVDGGNQAAATWTDFTCSTCGGQGTSLTSQPEIWGAGSWTPLGGYLASASRYWRGLQATNSSTIWPSTSAGFDPIRNDPTNTAFLPLGCDPNPATCTTNCCLTQCRPYITIMLTDGEETCGGNAVPVAQSMLNTVIDNREYRIETKVIGFGITPGDPDIEAYAQAGGAVDLPGTYEGYYANDEASLQLALSQILADAVKVETCNNQDDDCDGTADEDFLPPRSVPGKGGTCSNGQLGICARTGTLVCRADGAGLECNAPTITAGSETTTPCNQLDDDCDGRVDEGQTCTNCIPTGETCDGEDDDCDGVADQICRCSNDINVRCDGVGNDCGGNSCVCTRLTRPCGIGACGGTEECTAPNTWTGCTADTPDPNGESCNGLDDDCDGLCDGFTLDCSDFVTPGGPQSDSPGSPDHWPAADAPETMCIDAIDNDKDGFVNDGCATNGAAETGAQCANAMDDDGDTAINDGCPVPALPIAQNICRPGVKTCSLGCTQPKAFGACSGETLPCNGQSPCTDPCNGIDDDCDNKIDEGFVSADCSTNCGLGQTSCSNGTIVCDSVMAGVDNDCDGEDEDCDNMFDEHWMCPDVDGTPGCDECTEGGTICMGVPRCVAGDVVCEGDPVGTEVCNCANDDCDANIDEGTQNMLCPGGGTCVNCQCAFECTMDEFPCPIGKRCQVTPTGNYCVNDPCFNVTCPVPTSGNHQTCRPKAAFPNEHECVDTCSTVNCGTGTGLICYGPSGECRPDDCTTFPERCAGNENCIAGTCVVNPCQGVSCDGTTYCVGGECVQSCSDVDCPAGQRCRMGTCEEDPCDKQCPFGQACNDNTGECIEDPCKFRQCNTGQWCNPNSGQCEEDACVSSGVTCPNAGEVCRGGSCIDPNDTGPDAGTGTFVTVGGGGCNTSEGSTSVWFALAFALGLALRRRRRAAIAFVGLALASTQLSCTINQYCVGCEVDDAGSGSGDMDALDDSNGSGSDDVMVDAGCLPTGPEICDGTDNDCDGLTDNGTLPEVGTACTNVMGACAGGVKECFQGALRCDKRPLPEQCDEIDNNCNGAIDEGDPGGGGKCGTDQGECIAGTLHCQTAAGCNPAANCDPLVPGNTCCVKCVGFTDTRTAMEECDGEDDDCDTDFDEDVGTLGTCGPATDVGECQFGTLICQGGGTVCSNAKFPAFELCNGLDDDCDGSDDEIFDTQTDPRNCGACNTVCPTPSRTCVNAAMPSFSGMSCTTATTCGTGGSCSINSQVVCATGTCDYTCNPGFVDRDTMAANGCEYRCFATGQEVCDGVDNDCDGMIDNGLTPPAICLAGGECGMTAPTAVCNGASGWGCTYPGTTQFPETRCDGLNNDCDANVDENQPNIGQACDDGGIGVCKGTGVFACNTTNETTRNGPATCSVTTQGMTMSAEACDDKDNDCDGKTDEGSQLGNLLGQDWVTIGGGRQIMKYEASRMDSTDTQQGTKSGTIAATIAASPGGATQSGAVATFTTTVAHGLTAGTKVRVSGVAVSGYNGLWTIATTPTTTTFTATVASTGLAASGGGTVTKFIGACSKPSAIPWTNVTYPEALAVCESMGASLCSETRWHQACGVIAPSMFPIAINNGTAVGNGTLIQAEDFFENVARGGPETACTGTTDDDGDGLANDGCPAVISGGGAETACNDAVDSDGDGRVNDGCPVTEDAGGESGAECNNNSDDDGDGRDNDGCLAVQEDGETGADCLDTNDDDGDGFENDGCPMYLEDVEYEALGHCDDNGDDDGDGRDNDGCPQVGPAPETICTGTSNNDEDMDGRANDGCPAFIAESGSQCTNNSDDDGDGRDNDGCPAVGPAETNCTGTTNNDDDSDGTANDGCPPFSRAEETGAQCSNNDDDDGDGVANDGCPVVTSGIGPEVGGQCDNNSDDDGDGRDNDGCPITIAGSGPEVGAECANAGDDDGDGTVNDGCPEFIGGAEQGADCAIGSGDNDGDGVANDGCPSLGPHAWQEDYTPPSPDPAVTTPQRHLGMSNMRALPNGGAFIDGANILTQSPYLGYQVTIPQSATNWRVWVRMYSPTGADDRVHVSVSQSATPVAPTQTLETSVNGQWIWMSTTDLDLTMGTNYIRLFMRDDGLKVDAIFIARTATPTPTSCPNGSTSSTASCITSDGGNWSYATNPDTYQAAVCNGADRTAANDDITATGAQASCYADHDGAGTAAHVFDMSGNVKEWTLARLPGQNPIRGGASNDTATGISCGLNFILGTDTFFFPNVGFRCCKGP